MHEWKVTFLHSDSPDLLMLFIDHFFDGLLKGKKKKKSVGKQSNPSMFTLMSGRPGGAEGAYLWQLCGPQLSP